MNVRSCLNHDWRTGDHTHLAMITTLTVVVRHKVRPRGKENRLHRIRYRYKEALTREKRANEHRTGYLPQHHTCFYDKIKKKVQTMV